MEDKQLLSGIIYGFGSGILIAVIARTISFLYERSVKRYDVDKAELRDLRETIGIEKQSLKTAWKSIDELRFENKQLLTRIHELEIISKTKH